MTVEAVSWEWLSGARVSEENGDGVSVSKALGKL